MEYASQPLGRKSKVIAQPVAPSRRLAPRPTLKLAIPKYPNADQHFVAGNQALAATAPIITSAGVSKSGGLRKASPPLNGIGQVHSQIDSAARTLRNPSMTLNSADVKNNNDIFSFGKESKLSPVDYFEKAAFSEIAATLSSHSSNSSPPNFSRMFSLSPPSMRSYQLENMSDFSDTTQHVSPATTLLENFHKKTGTLGSTTMASATNTRQNLIDTSSSSSSSLKETSSTSQQVVNSSSTTTRVEKKSQRLHQVTSSSSSSSSSSEMKKAALQRDLNEIKNSMSEINDLAMGRGQPQPLVGDLKMNAMNQLKERIRSSFENIVDTEDEPLVTYPDGDDDHHENLNLSLSPTELTHGHLSSAVDTVKFEEKRTKSESTTKVVTDGFSSEQAISNSAEMKRLQTGDIDYQEAKAASAMRNRLEKDGVKAEQNAAIIKEAQSLRAGDVTQQSSNNVAAASIKVQSNTFSAENKAISQAQQRQIMTSSGGIINKEKHVSSASQSNYSYTSKGVCSTGSSMISSSQMSKATNGSFMSDLKFDDLDRLTSASDPKDIENAICKYSTYLNTFVKNLQEPNASEGPLVLDRINDIIRKAWAVPTHGHELGYSLCNSLRQSGGLDLLIKNCVEGDLETKFSSARLLEQCLTTENRSHVVKNGLDKVVKIACSCTKDNTDADRSRVGTGILENLFKHSEATCSDVIKLGGLDALLYECRKNDVEVLRHCAGALANLSLYGGADNQEAMINRKVPMWLYPLAFHVDNNIKYYACLAIAVLVANKEIEAEVLKSETLELVEPFVTTNNPSEFAKSNLAHAHGQSKHWLKRLVPVLNSNREEARNLAAFHFCMEAGIKKEQGNTEIFNEIGAIEPLKVVASCPNAIASKFAAQALRLIGEQVPHKLSQQVPLWSVEDVQEWVKQIGFGEYEATFAQSKVDGDLLLKLTEDNLREDILIENGILRKRFARELQNLKKMADYSSKDSAQINAFLNCLGPEYCTYTYSMLNAGVDQQSLRQLNEDMLIAECGIHNSIHRLRILNAVKKESSLPNMSEEKMAKTLDVFVSYRRSNGSQLASLLKVHLQLRGFSVFIDVERLEAGKFDNGLLNSIRQAKHFILVLTPDALHRCIGDNDGKDWVHREIVEALKSECNIIPICDSNFKWPEQENLPEDMRTVCHFNGVTWIHDYQDACIDKLERFMRGEKNVDRIVGVDGMTPATTPGTASTNRQNPPNYQRMHSNDSDYGNGQGGGMPTSTGRSENRFRKSSSPARHGFGGSGGVGGINMFARVSQRNPLLPYRTSHLLGMPVSGSMGNVGGRRSSAVTIGNRNQIPVAINARSHSLDGLLDDNNGHAEKEAETVVPKREKSSLTVDKQNRKSRSLDHLLNEIPIEPALDDANSKSLENIAKAPAETVRTSPDRVSSSRHSPEGISSADDEIDDNVSTYSTLSKGGKGNNKTFIDRAAKKLRSLIKKQPSDADKTKNI